MAAVKSLCRSGVVLRDGQMDFTGNVDKAIDYYLSNTVDYSQKKVIDGVDWKEAYITLHSIKLNGTECAESTIATNREYVNVEVHGETSVEIHADLMVKFSTLSGTPLATFAEGQYKGVTEHILPGAFSFRKRIRLPKYLSRGDYSIDIYLHQPYVCYYMRAEHCAEIHVDGNMDEYCHSLDYPTHGFCGLESI